MELKNVYSHIERPFRKTTMMRTNLIPQNTATQIAVPQSYVSKKVEGLLYALEEITEIEKMPYTLAMVSFKP